jgi:sarcosine oxidase subunit gamma
MVEALPIASPLDAARLAGGAHPATTISLAPAEAHFVFRGAEAARLAAGAALGVTFPTTPCRAAQTLPCAALWLGPDEWLLLAPPNGVAAVPATLRAALRDVPYSLVDVTHRHVSLLLQGEHAARVLNGGCPLDLDEGVFPPGACTRTVLAKATVIIRRQAQHSFHVTVWRSFAPYLWDFLIETRTRL